MRNTRKMWAVIAIAGSLFAIQCQKESLNTPEPEQEAEAYDVTGELKCAGDKTFYGPAVHMGNGAVRTFVVEDRNGDPKAVGILMSKKALDNLPHDMTEFVLEFPKASDQDFYTHATVDWNPAGHEPEHVYTLPHFDFHFYTIPLEERLAIGPNDTIQFENLPDSIYIPPFYFKGPGGVPQMGSHWVDLLSPEISGSGIFTKTFIWGSYDGKFTFWEPMVTRDYLLSNPVNSFTAVRQPQAYQRSGWYAQNYKVSYNSRNGERIVALTNLVYVEGQ
ncbi:MAG TPA: DUF5602 domain-containing protein [Bacteroidales bacterium]|nr:DUF5602 domain-containing protein [Bacteroidales bacterium]